MEYAILFVVALIATIIDIKTRKIPNWLVLILFICWFSFFNVEGLLTCIGCFVFLLLLSKKGFGMGDVKYLSVVALYLGFFNTCICLLASCISFVVVSLITKKKILPFAPFIFIGILLVIAFKFVIII